MAINRYGIPTLNRKYIRTGDYLLSRYGDKDMIASVITRVHRNGSVWHMNPEIGFYEKLGFREAVDLLQEGGRLEVLLCGVDMDFMKDMRMHNKLPSLAVKRSTIRDLVYRYGGLHIGGDKTHMLKDMWDTALYQRSVDGIIHMSKVLELQNK